jgi:dihydropteroate synthase
LHSASVVETLTNQKIRISLDSYQVETQRFGISHKVDYLNDIQGFPYRDFYPELSEAECKLIVMHSVQRIGGATRIDVTPNTIIETIIDFFSQRIADLTAAGIDKERLILDPGMGFFLGTNPETSFTVLRKLVQIREAFDLPLLVSVSRKSFLRKITGRSTGESGAATLGAEIALAFQGIDYIRTHDVRALNDAFTVIAAIHGCEIRCRDSIVTL